jgi:hypothetical protein
MMDGALPDQDKDNFFQGFISQLGIPVSEAKYRNGKLITTEAWIEAAKLAGFNIRYIPYELIEGEVNKEIPSLKRLAEKIKAIQEGGTTPWAGKTTKEGKPMTETQWLISEGLMGRGRTMNAARESMEKEYRDRAGGLTQTTGALRRVGYDIDAAVDGPAQKPAEDYARKVQEALRKLHQPKPEDPFKKLLQNR